MFFRRQRKIVCLAIRITWFRDIKCSLISNKRNIILVGMVKSIAMWILRSSNQQEISCQKHFEKLHKINKCSGVSSSLPQKVHKGESANPNLHNFVLVNIILFKSLYWQRVLDIYRQPFLSSYSDVLKWYNCCSPIPRNWIRILTGTSNMSKLDIVRKKSFLKICQFYPQ